MIKSKLVRIFNALTRKEINEFGRYLRTPFFNRNDRPLTLYKFLKKYSEDEDKLSKEQVYDRIFPEETYDNRRIHEVMTDTSLLLQDYLTLSETKTNKLDKQYLLLRAFRTRNLDGDYLELLDKMHKDLEQSEERDMYYYFHKQRLYHCRYQNPKVVQLTEESDYIEQVMLNLDLCYAMAKLKFACELRLRSLIMNQPLPPNAVLLLSEIRNLSQKYWKKANPLFEIYLLTLEFLEQVEFDEPQFETYAELKKLLSKHLNLASDSEQRSLLITITDAAGLAAYYNENYLKECLEWYQYGLEKKILFEEGCIAHLHFVNMVILGSELGLPDWIKRLKEHYLKYIRTEFKYTSERIVEAFFLFTQCQYGDVIQIMEEVRFKNIIFKLQQRALMIRSLYEVGNLEEVSRLCENFRVFLTRSRSRIADEVINANENFIKIVKRLIGEEPSCSNDLNEELKASERVICRLWLQEKIKEAN